LAGSVPELVLFRLIAGVGAAMWSLSRHAFITESIDPRERGRALSVFGGIHRIGMFGGPAVGGVIGEVFSLSSAFYVSGGLAAAGLVIASIYVRDTRVHVHSS